MLVNGKSTHTIRVDDQSGQIFIIDQRLLPFDFREVELRSAEEAFTAIKDMMVRGAPLIGVTAAFGFYLGLKQSISENSSIQSAVDLASYLKSARPTAVNLAWAIDRMFRTINGKDFSEQLALAFKEALTIRNEELERCRQIGIHGVELIRTIYQKNGGNPVQVLTHCNAGWLACIDYGTALAPVYQAWNENIPVHVWVDETRPRNQGSKLTAWELKQQGIPCTLIVDNAGGHLMQQGKIDLVLVGTDRTALNGDVANKIGTYLKALAAFDNHVPFYVAAPSTSIDLKIENGHSIPIEERDGNEVRFVEGVNKSKPRTVRISPLHTMVSNPGFDVTPARLITGLITERGLCPASKEGIKGLFPEWNL